MERALDVGQGEDDDGRVDDGDEHADDHDGERQVGMGDTGGAPGRLGALARPVAAGPGEGHPATSGPARSMSTRMTTRRSVAIAERNSPQSGCSPATWR